MVVLWVELIRELLRGGRGHGPSGGWRAKWAAAFLFGPRGMGSFQPELEASPTATAVTYCAFVGDKKLNWR